MGLTFSSIFDALASTRTRFPLSKINQNGESPLGVLLGSFSSCLPWVTLVTLLGRSWTLLGRSGDALGRSWDTLGRSRALLEGSWGTLGRVLGAPEAHLGPYLENNLIFFILFVGFYCF